MTYSFLTTFHSKSSRPNTAHSSVADPKKDENNDCEVYAEAPGFTLDLNILLKLTNNKHSISTNIVNIFVENLSQLKCIYNFYANLGVSRDSSNAILTRLQYGQRCKHTIFTRMLTKIKRSDLY